MALNKTLTQDEYAVQLAEKKKEYANVGDQLIEKWSKNKVGTVRLKELAGKNIKRARNTAILLENQLQHLKKLRENSPSSIQQTFQTTPETVLRIIRIAAANSNRGDIFHEWGLTTPRDTFYIQNTTVGTVNAASGATIGQNISDTSLRDFGASTRLQEFPATTNATTSVITGTLAPANVVPFSIKFLATTTATKLVTGYQIVGNDDGNGSGTFSFDDKTVTVAINYATGAITLTGSANFSQGVQFAANFVYDSENDANFDSYEQVNISFEQRQFHCSIRPLGYSYSKASSILLGTSGLGDIDQMLVQAVAQQHAKRKDSAAIRLAKQYAAVNPITTFDADFATAGEDNDYNHAQRISTSISNVAGDIFNTLERGGINRIVCSTKAKNYLAKNRNWQGSTVQNAIGSTYLSGMLDGVPVYVTSVTDTDKVNSLSENELLLTYRNPIDEGEVSLVYGVHTELFSTLDYPTFHREGNVATFEDNQVVQPSFLRLLKIDNLTNE